MLWPQHARFPISFAMRWARRRQLAEAVERLPRCGRPAKGLSIIIAAPRGTACQNVRKQPRKMIQWPMKSLGFPAQHRSHSMTFLPPSTRLRVTQGALWDCSQSVPKRGAKYSSGHRRRGEGFFRGFGACLFRYGNTARRQARADGEKLAPVIR